MYNVLTLNKISPVGLKGLKPEKYNVADSIDNPDAILLRSYKMHDMELPDSLLAVGRAGAGVNNIPVDKCSEKGIVVFNTPGGNANAVKELVLAGLLLASRDIVGGIAWAGSLKGESAIAKTVEGGKGSYAGHEINGKKLGVIGLGAIGVLTANAANGLGMQVYGVDPFLSVNSALHLHPSVKVLESADELSDCDFISVHVPLTGETKGMINKDYIAKLKPGVVILNFSRGELVDDVDIKAALTDGSVGRYVTDFPNENTVGVEGIIAIPHLGASTDESEENCAKMAAREIRHYLEYGNIVNSVNFPTCTMQYTGKTRFAVIHKNVPKVIAAILDTISGRGYNIDNMINKSRDDIAYTIIDVEGNGDTDNIVQSIEAIGEVVRVRVIKPGK